MLFHNLIPCFPVVFTLFYPKYELKFSIFGILNYGSPSKIGLGSQGHSSKQYCIWHFIRQELLFQGDFEGVSILTIFV